MNKNPNYGLFAVAVAVALVGAVWLGVPLGTLAPLAIVLVCPLMMMFMMRGMHNSDHGGGSEHHHPADRQNHDSTSPR
jgi:Flp pilus assembly protein TadB